MNKHTEPQARCLSEYEKQSLAPFFAASTLNIARIIDGKVPFWLRSCMCAVVLHNKIYFRHGAYQAHSVAGLALLAHELTHVEQFLSGMTVWRYCWASRFGYARNCYEKVAIRVENEVKVALSQSK